MSCNPNINEILLNDKRTCEISLRLRHRWKINMPHSVFLCGGIFLASFCFLCFCRIFITDLIAILNSKMRYSVTLARYKWNEVLVSFYSHLGLGSWKNTELVLLLIIDWHMRCVGCITIGKPFYKFNLVCIHL